MFSLEAGESQILASDDEPTFEDDFVDTHPIQEGPVFKAHFETGRDWESKKTEKGETIRVQPDPELRVYRTTSGVIVALAVAVPNPIIFSAFHVGHDDLTGFIERLVRGLDTDYDGIKTANVTHSEVSTEELRVTISDAVEEMLEAA